MTAPERINHLGEWLTFGELAKRSGVSASCLRKRFEQGQRGTELVRPGHRGRCRDEASTNPQVEALRAKQEVRAAVEREEQERKLSRQLREREARDRIAAEHAKAFARPLIDSKLVKPRERQAIADRVKYCGQRNWSLKGLA